MERVSPGRDAPSRRSGGERGVGLVEYALVVALVVVVSLGAIRSLETRTADEVDNQAECISSRPPPPSCQKAPLAGTGGGGGAGPGGGGGGGGPGTTQRADLATAPSVVVTDSPPTFEVQASYRLLDESGAPIPDEVVTAQVTVTQSSFAGRVGQFFYVDCVSQTSGTCSFAFDSRHADVKELRLEIVAVGIDTPYDIAPAPSTVTAADPSP